MDNVHKRFTDKFRNHWIKVKFYEKKPINIDAEILEDVRFCQATKEAILRPVLLNKESIVCPGAQHAFGWDVLSQNELLNACGNKRKVRKDTLMPALSQAPYLKKRFEYIGLNTSGIPDLIMSYISPQEIMKLVKIYSNKQSASLDVCLSSMMAICSGIAART